MRIHHPAAHTHTSIVDSSYCWRSTIRFNDEKSLFAVASWDSHQCSIKGQPGPESWRLHTHSGTAIWAVQHFNLLCGSGVPAWSQSTTNCPTTSTSTWSWWTFYRCWSCTTTYWWSRIAAVQRFCNVFSFRAKDLMDQWPCYSYHSYVWRMRWPTICGQCSWSISATSTRWTWSTLAFMV